MIRVNKTQTSCYSSIYPYAIYSIVLNAPNFVTCMACLFGNTIKEIVKSINFSHEEWSNLLEIILYFVGGDEFPIFSHKPASYILCSTK